MLTPDFREFLQALDEQHVDYLIVGAFAMAAHGIVRSTGDLDIWIQTDAENAKRTIAALKSFGAPLFDLKLTDLSQPGMVFQIGVSPCRIDILTSIDGVEFDEAWPRHQNLELDGYSLRVISREQLIENKLAAARPKDLADVARLTKRRKPPRKT